LIGTTELLLLGFAAYRATRIAVHDQITDPLRNPLFTWHANRPTSPLRTALITLISCTYCAGWWISGAILATYLTASGTWHDTPLAIHGVEWLAVAGAAALGNRWDDTRPDTAQ
jgi:hypothetical protein